MEQWILNKLDVAASEVNKYLAERNFMAATNSVYNFWLYELCDVYIVSCAFYILYFHFMFVGSNETNDGRFRTARRSEIRSGHIIFMSRPRLKVVASFHALCDGGIVAASAKTNG